MLVQHEVTEYDPGCKCLGTSCSIFIGNSSKTVLYAIGTREKTFIDVKLWSLLVISINVSKDKWTLRGSNH